MNVPTDYVAGYKAARAVDPQLASDYVAHTLIGDPQADAVTEALAAYDQRTAGGFIQAGMNRDAEGLREAPPVVREFFQGLESPPDWVDFSAFDPGIRMFHRNSRLILGAFVGGTLVEGFSTNISKSFFITGRLRDQGVRRLRQNNRQMFELFIPGGLERDSDGWKLSVRVRLVHAQVRYLLSKSDDWDTDAWGVPLSSAHVGFAITAFSARLLKHMKSLGAVFDDEERQSFMSVWRYAGYLMGIPETILYRDETSALQLFDIGLMCEPAPDFESISLAHSLINSAPLIVGIDDPATRRGLAKYVFTVSRELIGDRLADQLKYPKRATYGALVYFRMQEFYDRVMGILRPSRVRNNNLTRFTALLEASAYDEGGITYQLPDHVYAEESSRW